MTMGLTASRRFAPAGEYAGIAFHRPLLTLVASISAPLVGIASGFLWVGCDVIASTGLIWHRGGHPEARQPAFGPIRMAGSSSRPRGSRPHRSSWGRSALLSGACSRRGLPATPWPAAACPNGSLAAPGLLLLWLILLAGRAQVGSLDTGSLQMHAPSPQAGTANWRKPA